MTTPNNNNTVHHTTTHGALLPLTPPDDDFRQQDALRYLGKKFHIVAHSNSSVLPDQYLSAVGQAEDEYYWTENLEHAISYTQEEGLRFLSDLDAALPSSSLGKTRAAAQPALVGSTASTHIRLGYFNFITMHSFTIPGSSTPP